MFFFFFLAIAREALLMIKCFPVLLLKIYLPREKGSQRVCMGEEGQRERETESQADSAFNGLGLHPGTLRS